MVKKPWKSKGINPPLDKTPKKKLAPPSDVNAMFKWRVSDRYMDYYYDRLGWCSCEPLPLLKGVVKGLFLWSFI